MSGGGSTRHGGGGVCSGSCDEIKWKLAATTGTARRALTTTDVTAFRALIIENTLENVAANVYSRLIGVLVVCVVHCAYSYTPEYCLGIYFRWKVSHWKP